MIDDHSTPATASDEAPTTAGSVVVAVLAIPGTDPSATLAAVAGQRHRVEHVRLIGGEQDAPIQDDESVSTGTSVEEWVEELGQGVDYVWILHGDARPRPNALGALVLECGRNDASLGGSKLLVEGKRDTLEAVGSATDVFGEPYSGLDEGEVDLEQYDVVREVAFVPSVSMLVRRDLLRGLRGLDPRLPPVSAGLDLSQRIRVAGGRVIVVPSSEVFHQSRCGRGDGGWREQAGRFRAMLKSYRPITLLWMVPFALLTGIIDSVGSLLLGRWRLAPRYVLTWLWNLIHLPGTIALRRNIARVRQVSDEELFRYQVAGSVRLKQLGLELTEWMLGVFDEDRLMARRTTAALNSSGAWAALLAVVAVLVGGRRLLFNGFPVAGFSAPSADSPGTVLARFFGDWNRAGLGSDQAIHPAAGIAAAVDAVVPGGEMAARFGITIAAVVLGIFGFARLARRLRIRGAGGYAGFLLALFGPTAALLGETGQWAAIVSICLLPWAFSILIAAPATGLWPRVGRFAGSILLTGMVALFNPWLAVTPALFVLGVKVLGRFPADVMAGLAGLSGGLVAAAYVGTRPERLLDGGWLPATLPTVEWALLAVVIVVAMASGTWRTGFLAGVMTFGALVGVRYVGPDLQVGLLALASVGSGLALAATLKSRTDSSIRGWVGVLVGVAALASTLPGLGGGRLGLPADEWGDALALVSVEPIGVERTLLIGSERWRLPGDARPGPGFWYRTVEGGMPTLDQLILGDPGPGDEALGSAIERVASGSLLDPGAELAEFGIRWVVIVDEAATLLRPALTSQIDLEPLPLADGFLVYANLVPGGVAETDTDEPWLVDGAGFSGPVSNSVELALQGDARWAPGWEPVEWRGRVNGAEGVARFGGDKTVFWLTTAGVTLLGCAALSLIVARGRRP